MAVVRACMCVCMCVCVLRHSGVTVTTKVITGQKAGRAVVRNVERLAAEPVLPDVAELYDLEAAVVQLEVVGALEEVTVIWGRARRQEDVSLTGFNPLWLHIPKRHPPARRLTPYHLRDISEFRILNSVSEFRVSPFKVSA